MDVKFAQALHLLVYVAETKATASSQALAQSVGTNASHIRKLTGALKAAGILESSQGRAGFTLAKPKEDITLADIHQALYTGRFLFKLHQDPNPDCPIGKHIEHVLAPTFGHLESQLTESLATVTLAALIENLYLAAEMQPQKAES